VAVARTSHSLTCGGLTCVDLTSCGASIDPPPMLLAGLAMDEDQAEHRGEQQDRREQTDAGLSDKRPGDQVGDSDSQRDAPDDQQPASATHLRSSPDQVRPGGDVQDGHAANGFAGNPYPGRGRNWLDGPAGYATSRLNEHHRNAH